MKEERLVDDYYQSNIKTSRNEDSVYAMKYASQQILIDKLEEENKSLQSQLKEKEEELKYTIGIVEHNKIVSEKNKQIKQLKEIIKEAREYLEGVYEMSYYTKSIILDKEGIEELDEILSKGENK